MSAYLVALWILWKNIILIDEILIFLCESVPKVVMIEMIAPYEDNLELGRWFSNIPYSDHEDFKSMVICTREELCSRLLASIMLVFLICTWINICNW
jgi:hypothetical protein